MPDGSAPDQASSGYRDEDSLLSAAPPQALHAERRVKRDRPIVNLVLLALTVVTTTVSGGPWYSVTILAILGAHELGHYFACRYYRVDASLPYFLPVPPQVVLTGTLGAFIRIRRPVYNKRVLFDIGVAGPFAGFIVAVPALLAGVALSRLERIPSDFAGLWLGEPLLFKAVSWIVWGSEPEGYDLVAHPMLFASWFGLIATMLNLFPIGQLDGGHVSYAVFGRKSSYVTLAAVGMAVTLTIVSLSWLFWAVLMLVMLLVFGPHHPRTVDEHVPLDRTRRILAGVAFLIFIACFTPSPIRLVR